MPRRHPLIWYFVLANGFSWLTLFLLGGWLDLSAQLVVLVFTIGPTAAAVTMTAIIDGRSGVRDLLGRIVLWRVGLRWYAVTLLGIPLVVLLATFALPGVVASFSPMSPVRWFVTYVIVFGLGGIAGVTSCATRGWHGDAGPRGSTHLSECEVSVDERGMAPLITDRTG